MSKLDEIVPDLELCKLIPEGEFADSALVWTPHGVRSVEELGRLEFCKGLPIRKMTIPAPTQVEIMSDMSKTRFGLKLTGYRGRWRISMGPYSHLGDNTASAALRLWMRLRGIDFSRQNSGDNDGGISFPVNGRNAPQFPESVPVSGTQGLSGGADAKEDV